MGNLDTLIYLLLSYLILIWVGITSFFLVLGWIVSKLLAYSVFTGEDWGFTIIGIGLLALYIPIHFKICKISDALVKELRH